MFQSFGLHVNLFEKDAGSSKPRTGDPCISRISPKEVEITRSNADNLKHFDDKRTVYSVESSTDHNRLTESSNTSMSLTSKASFSGPTKTVFKFDKVIGPNADNFSIYQEIKPVLHTSHLETFISVGLYNPIMVNLADASGSKNQINYIFKSIEELCDGKITINLSCFVFNGPSLVDMLSSQSTQMIFGFELNYLQFNKNTHPTMASSLKDIIGKKLREINLNPKSIFYYASVSAEGFTSPFRYLMCDVFQAFVKDAKTPGSVLAPELSALNKYIGFDANKDEVNLDEQTDSLDIFFNELVQERNQRVTIISCIPIDHHRQSDSYKLLELSSQYERIATIFNSFTFQLVHSQAARMFPIRHTSMAAQEDSEEKPGLQSKRQSLRPEVQGSNRKMDAEGQSRGISRQNSIAKARVTAGVLNQDPSQPTPTKKSIPAAPGRLSMSHLKETTSSSTFQNHSKPPPSNLTSFPQHQPPLQPLTNPSATSTNQQQPLLHPLIPSNILCPDTRYTELASCILHQTNRLEKKQEIIEYQNYLLTQKSLLSKDQQKLYSTLYGEMDMERQNREHENNYMKGLIRCIGEYAGCKDGQRKQKIIEAVKGLNSVFQQKTIQGLLNLLRD
jgi:hypothetical protein